MIELLRYKTWIFLAFLRILISLIPQYGYIHPDEFFQTVEVAAGTIFGLNVTRTWEFEGNRPVRSWSQVVLSSYPPLYILKILSQSLPEFDITPRRVIVLERLYMCLLSFIADLSVYKYFTFKDSNLKQKTNLKMAVFASSSVMLVFACRSFTNTLELIIFSLLFLPSFKKSNIKSIIFFSFVAVLGTFIRPTFLFFSLVPYLHRFNSVKSMREKLHFISKHVIFCILFSAFFILFDSYSYGLLKPTQALTYLQQHGLRSFLSCNVTTTPVNFILYNSDAQNLASHGVHSRLTHSTINIFLLFNSLILIAYKKLFTNTIKLTILPHLSAISLWFIPLCLLSIFPHQEPRFLIPLLLPLTTSYARPLCKSKLLVHTWLIFNLVFSLFYGFIHQAGLIKALIHARSDITASMHSAAVGNHSSDVDLFFWRSYMPPQHLLLLPHHSHSPFCLHNQDDEVCRRAGRVRVVDLAGKIEEAFTQSVVESSANDAYVYSSGSVLAGDECEVEGGMRLVVVSSYWPHFSGEDLFFKEPIIKSISCNTPPFKLQHTINSYFSPLFGFPMPGLLAQLIDKTSFKVFKLQKE